MAYRNIKKLWRRKVYDKVLRDKTFNTVKNPNYDGYQRGLASMVYKFFDKKSSKIMLQRESAEKLHKLMISKFQKLKVCPSIKDNTWGVELADTVLISKFNKRFPFFIMC